MQSDFLALLGRDTMYVSPIDVNSFPFLHTRKAHNTVNRKSTTTMQAFAITQNGDLRTSLYIVKARWAWKSQSTFLPTRKMETAAEVISPYILWANTLATSSSCPQWLCFQPLTVWLWNPV
ncbi:hypothetical protein XELAEV_18017770mg [Xenopus laevis]|uniref:Uncharacterized protein n=1 Tax=Xenopus laevis TaxID=8355 RepID=A0A974DBR9_XENLA|nr:hypothetical protein XELAEV_18017770mg [Xenopus laevis]